MIDRAVNFASRRFTRREQAKTHVKTQFERNHEEKREKLLFQEVTVTH